MSTSWPPPPPVRAGAPRWAIALIALVTALLMVVGAVIVLTLTGGIASADEVTREPVNTAGANPFMPAVGTDAERVAAPAGTGGAYRGDTPGLYGGTRDDRACDAAKLTDFLGSHPAQAAAWAGVLGIRVSEIDSYVATLTPVLLRSDTWVTNHGYADGRATVVGSVLQAGTAVFVDRYGSPVVRCYCGNPLTAPTLVASPTYIGPTWYSFSQTNVTIVQSTTTVVHDYVVVDPWRYAPFVRTPGYEPGLTPRHDGDYTGAPLGAPTPVSGGGPGGASGPSARSGSPGGDTTPADLDPGEIATCPDGTKAGTSNIAATAVDDLTGDGRDDTTVLVECGDEQQVQVIDAATGTLVSTVTSQTPPGSPLPAEFDPTAFSLDGTTLTTGMKVYGADDTASAGPSESQTWRWTWNGRSFDLAPGSTTAVTPADPTSGTPSPSVDPVTPSPTSSANAGN